MVGITRVNIARVIINVCVLKAILPPVVSPVVVVTIMAGSRHPRHRHLLSTRLSLEEQYFFLRQDYCQVSTFLLALLDCCVPADSFVV
jgi:hypothetical protein